MTQLVTVVSIGGTAGVLIAKLFDQWRSAVNAIDRDRVDRLCESVCAHKAELPILHFCEWIDHWLSGNDLPGPGAVEGKVFSATSLTPNQAFELAGKINKQFDEQIWFGTRLREAADRWDKLVESRIILIL